MTILTPRLVTPLLAALLLVAPAFGQTGISDNGGLGNSAPALRAPTGDPGLQNPSALSPSPMTVPATPPPPRPAPVLQPVPQPCAPPFCGAPRRP
ncbi:MAG TPA: hypothetical protein VLA00_16660 [Xanthobacteraceae bacterium]|nr:hypothetical protein [Xanthobacteraceae bacterium]